VPRGTVKVQRARARAKITRHIRPALARSSRKLDIASKKRLT